MTSRERCEKHVFSGARWDTGGHQCGNKAIQGEKFCHLHAPRDKTADPTAPARSEPSVRQHSSTTMYSTATWAYEEGPVVKVPFTDRYGFVEVVVAKKVDSRPASFTAGGVFRLKDGTPGRVPWKVTYGAERLLDTKLVELLLKNVGER